MSESLDTEKLEREVRAMYRDIAEESDAEFHFETGWELAERLGYDLKSVSLVAEKQA